MSHSDHSEGLMGAELFLWGILEPNTDIYSSICSWNKFKLIFSNKTYVIQKNTHLFLAFKELDIETKLSL